MDFLWLGNSLRAWSSAALVAVATFLLLGVVRRGAARHLSALAGRTRNHADDLIAALLRGTRAWFLLLIAVRAGSEWVELGSSVGQLLRGTIVLALVVQGALWGNVLVAHLLQAHAQRRGETDMVGSATVGALGFVARLLLWSLLLLLGLDNLGVDITALVAGLGVGGVAVALAVQNILGDLFASLSIVLDKPFVPGDFIIVGDMLGTVEHIGLKTTRVRSLHGEQIVFSNTDLLNSRIRNYKKMAERRVVFSLGVIYDTPREKLGRIPQMVRAVIEAQPELRFDRAHFKAFGPFSLDFEIVYYVLDPDYNRYMDMQQTINLTLVDMFAAEGIEFAFPTQTLHLNLAGAGAGAYRPTTSEVRL